LSFQTLSRLKYSNRMRYIAIALIFLIMGSVAGFLVGCDGDTAAYEEALVTRVIDGDTVELLDGQRVRYLCIDTPELGEDYYDEASRRNRELVEGKIVELWTGLEDRDVYGRLLRFVFVDGTFVNAELVAEGLATAYIFNSDERYSQLFVQLEEYAKMKDVGLWSQ